jgi:hypothetical protein
MTKTELSRSLAIAQAGNAGFPTDNIFDGFGLYEFQPVYCTVEQVAQLIVWQCFTFAGGIDYEALTEIADAGRRKFRIIGNGSDGHCATI